MLITFEGLDGSGKSTQVKLLKKHLIKENFDVLALREPGGVPIAEDIRELLLESKNDINAITELLLFSASRSELIKTLIIPALENQMIVILDRFYDSTVAYQGYGRKLNLDHIDLINKIASFNIKPDITFYLDILPEDSLLRKFSEKSLPLSFNDNNLPLDRMEKSGLDFYRNVRMGYKEILNNEPERVHELDALKKPSDIHKDVLKKLIPILNASKKTTF